MPLTHVALTSDVDIICNDVRVHLPQKVRPVPGTRPDLDERLKLDKQMERVERSNSPRVFAYEPQPSPPGFSAHLRDLTAREGIITRQVGVMEHGFVALKYVWLPPASPKL